MNLMNLSLEQERDILRAFAKQVLKKRGVNRFDHGEVRRDLGNLSKVSGFSMEAIYSVLHPITEELYNETFPSTALFPLIKEDETLPGGGMP